MHKILGGKLAWRLFSWSIKPRLGRRDPIRPIRPHHRYGYTPGDIPCDAPDDPGVLLAEHEGGLPAPGELSQRVSMEEGDRQGLVSTSQVTHCHAWAQLLLKNIVSYFQCGALVPHSLSGIDCMCIPIFFKKEILFVLCPSKRVYLTHWR